MKTIYQIVYTYPTKNKEGFTPLETAELLKLFPEMNMEKYNDAMMGNTGMIIDGEFITYPCDLFTAITCGVENRNMTSMEFD